MKKLKKILLWSLGIVVVAGVASIAIGKHYAETEYDGPEAILKIPGGTSKEGLRDSLVSVLGSFGSKVYTLWDAQRGEGTSAHGMYVVSPGDKAIAVARRLAMGRQSTMRFTFNNMRTFGDLAKRLGEKMEADSAAFAACADTLFAAQGFAPEELPAAVLPDTYEFYWTWSPERVFGVLTNARTSFWNEERLAKAESLGLTPTQVATVASIVEEETAKIDERPKVARLYLNRLNRGMRLQADPTVKFATGDLTLRRITAQHLSIQSPYNTYLVDGLPPGPIRIVEKSSLDAVLNAPEHNYLYMCARPDFSGYHDFSEGYDRHRINAAKYHRALRNRGI